MIGKILIYLRQLLSRLFAAPPLDHSGLDDRTVEEIEDNHWIG